MDGLKRYTLIAAVAFAIAVPVACFAVSRWLENFAEHIAMSAWTFILTFIVILALTLLIAGLQFWRSATTDPAEVLRKE